MSLVNKKNKGIGLAVPILWEMTLFMVSQYMSAYFEDFQEIIE